MRDVARQVAKLLARLDKEIAAAAEAVSGNSQDFERITSVPGIGLLTGSALLGLFRHLATRSSDAVIAFLGLDPRPMDSGQKTGLRRLSKRGPAEWRRLLSTPPCRPAAPRLGRRTMHANAPKALIGPRP